MHNRKLGRTSDHRKALLRNMATEVILRGRLKLLKEKLKKLRAMLIH